MLRRNHSRNDAALKICPQNIIFNIASLGVNDSRVIGHIVSLEDKSENIHLDVIRRIFVSVKRGLTNRRNLVGGPRKGRNGVRDERLGGVDGGGGGVVVGGGGTDDADMGEESVPDDLDKDTL